MTHSIETLIRNFKLPGTPQTLGEAGLIQTISAENDNVVVLLDVPEKDAEKLEPMRAELEERILAEDGIRKARVIMTAQRKASDAPRGPTPKAKAPPKPKPINGVKNLILIGSGKGGVGKSTSSVNLAFALQSLGLKVGFVDCDIYGPSATVLLGHNEKPQADENNLIIPIEHNGLLSISMSNLMDPDQAAVWRGPMVIKAVQQMLQGTRWDINGGIDVLIADLPPGTGDVQLTIAQTANVQGAIIVSTPQDLALIDARKANNMFQRTNTPVLGLIENMSYFSCPNCGHRTDIFGHGGGREMAKEHGLPFLGEIPLHMDIREHSDAGRPIVRTAPESALAEAYMSIARQISDTL